MEQKTNEKKTSVSHKIATAIGVVLCVILIPILIINVTLIIHSVAKPDEVPRVGSVFPLIVLTDSMYPDIKSGDLIICHTEDPEAIKEGDVIAFFDPAGNGTSIVTHSVAEVTEVDGQTAWITRGIANNTNDVMPVPAENLVGVYQTRIPGLGDVVMFMQTTAGLIVCVVCPIILLIAWDIFRRKKFDKSKQADTAALMEELEQLRAQQEKQQDDNHQTPVS